MPQSTTTLRNLSGDVVSVSSDGGRVVAVVAPSGRARLATAWRDVTLGLVREGGEEVVVVEERVACPKPFARRRSWARVELPEECRWRVYRVRVSARVQNFFLAVG
jgi:hypothetical protein